MQSQKESALMRKIGDALVDLNSAHNALLEARDLAQVNDAIGRAMVNLHKAMCDLIDEPHGVD